MSTPTSSFATFSVNGKAFGYYRLTAAVPAERLKRMPFSLRVLLENLLRREDGATVTGEDIAALAAWEPGRIHGRDIAFMPARVILQDFTGVPCAVDLATMRDAVADIGGDPMRVNPLQPVDLVIDHSLQVDDFGHGGALERNEMLEVQRNRERYGFLKWAQQAFRNFRVVPPGTGIVHQVNLEVLADVVCVRGEGGDAVAFPDTVIGTDSHTTMINGLGVLGWGVGGIEAEAAMLGQPVSMGIPEVVGVRLTGALAPGTTATDLVLTVTQVLRQKGVVGKFVEFFGPGARTLSLEDRATVANMAPEYGATIGFFPVDAQTIAYLSATGRSAEQVALVEAYTRAQRLFVTEDAPEPDFDDLVEVDLGAVTPSVAGPRRPQDRVSLPDVAGSFLAALPGLRPKGATAPPVANAPADGLTDGAVVLAAITSCTNTSNPALLLQAGMLAKAAVKAGLRTPPWVKTSFAPGSKVAVDYLSRAGLLPFLETLGFHVVGYGCATCIGNAGPLPTAVAHAIREQQLIVASVLSGNRNFEGRIHALVRANYLMSPPLVVAYALAGHIGVDLTRDPIQGKALLRDIWPEAGAVREMRALHLRREDFERRYGAVFGGDARWRTIPGGEGARYAWETASTYIRPAPFLDGFHIAPAPLRPITGARILAFLGDSVTTDHISPAGAIGEDTPAGGYLREKGVLSADFNSYGARRGNHEVMVRGTFANPRLKNRLVDREGGWTRLFPEAQEATIFAAAQTYAERGVPLIVVAGKDYGCGSSRDWAAKGPHLLGVRAVIAESFERIHRSNLVMMGILPLAFLPGETAAGHGLSGEDVFDVPIGPEGVRPGEDMVVRVVGPAGERHLRLRARVDTLREAAYFRNGGILPFAMREMMKGES